MGRRLPIVGNGRYFEPRKAVGRGQMMFVSNPDLHARTVTSFVETAQVAPTILRILGLDPESLDAVRKEGTPVLPGLDFED
jgi:hypothetical protein